MLIMAFLDWSYAIPPMKHPITYEEIIFSEWIESTRKDVECTFGVMKGQFGMLKNGARLESIVKRNQVWRARCALHDRSLLCDELGKG